MSKNLIQFFSTQDDILSVVTWIEEQRRFKYILTGLFENRNLISFEHINEFPNLGVAKNESAIAGDCYLVANFDSSISIREVPQVSGDVRYAIDQLNNPETVALQVGGFWGDDILLHGRVGTASGNPISIEIYRLFRKSIQKHFARVGAFYVGRNAAEYALKGCRLAISAQSPQEFDLAINKLSESNRNNI